MVLVMLIPGCLIFGNCIWKKKPEKPNIVLIVVDALRSDHLGAYGYSRPTSPFFDSLSREGVLFQEAFSQSTFTLTSIASLLTGLNPDVPGVFSNQDVLDDKMLTLAEALKANGYQTGCIQANPWVTPKSGFNQGFDWYQELYPDDLLAQQQKIVYRADQVTDQALAWLKEIKREQPFFLYLHYMETHSPYLPPAPFDQMFDPDFDHSLPDFTLMFRFLYGRDKVAMPAVLEEIYHERYSEDQLLQHIIALYDGEVRFFDLALEKLIKELQNRKSGANTLVIICSDHGEGFLEHGLLLHGKSLYQEMASVPLLFYFPAQIPKGKIIPEQVRSLDIFPTILELAGIPLPAHLDGQSLRPFWEGANRPEARTSYAHVYDSGKGAISSDGIEREYASITTPDWRFIKNLKNNEDQLYDRRLDSKDTNNLASSRPDQVKIFEQMLFRYFEESAKTKKALGVGKVKTGPVSPELRKKLEALGYFGP